MLKLLLKPLLIRESLISILQIIMVLYPICRRKLRENCQQKLQWFSQRSTLHFYKSRLYHVGWSLWWLGLQKYLISSLDQSLKRMNTDYVDVFILTVRSWNANRGNNAGIDFAVRSGRALYAGISNYNAEQTQQAVNILRELGTPCLIHQPKYSMFVRWTEEGLLDVLEDNGVGCIAFSPLAQGLLTDRYLKGIPENSRAAKSHGFLQKMILPRKNYNKLLLWIIWHRKESRHWHKWRLHGY